MPKGRILAVDDERYFRELIEGLLAEEGFEAESVSTGEEALARLERARFDVVVTDLVMPAMDGTELVRRIKERDPEQDVVVVTGVVDVKTAVEAMKLGANDYLLKPFDRATLAASLESILQRRRLRSEHERLLAENIEYLGERSLFERAIGLFSSLTLGPLCERIVEALSLETDAQGAVLWVAEEDDPSRLALAAARGLVRLDAEPETLDAGSLPPGVVGGRARSLLRDGVGAGARASLLLPMRRDGELIALARVGDKAGGGEFDPVDRSCAEKVARFAELALQGALRIRRLERRALRDPATGAYGMEYFLDLTRKEIERANRSGRGFSLLKVELGALDGLRRQLGQGGLEGLLARVVERLRLLSRTTDLVAGDGEGSFAMLLSDSDAVGAAQLKQRGRQALTGPDLLGELDAAVRPEPRLGIATFPTDGTRLETLMRCLDARAAEEGRSSLRVLGLEKLGFAASLEALLEEADAELPGTAEALVRFVLAEVRRRPRDRGVLYVAPGAALGAAVRESLEPLRGSSWQTEIAVVAHEPRPAELDPAVTWIAPPRGQHFAPFLLRLGDAPAYALIRAEKQSPDGARTFHSGDRSLIEHLLYRLRGELAATGAARR